jgi:6-phosphogluconolactonase
MKRTLVLGVSLLAIFAFATSAGARSTGTAGAVYTETNSPSGNAIAAFDRAADGTLTPAGTYATGGTGTGANVGSQGAVTLSDDGSRLFAVNAGSNSISSFSVGPNGLTLQDVVPSGGILPISVTVHDSLVYVLNAGGAGSITGFTVAGGSLTPLAGSTRPLGAGSSGPAQVQFSQDGSTLVVSEKASSTLDTYAVGADGRAGAPHVFASAGATPFGFDFDNVGHLLVSNASASASSYAVGADSSLTTISGAFATHQGAPCWLVATRNGKFAYTANAAGGTISGFAVAPDGSLTLLDASGATATLGAGSHPLDEAVSRNGRFLYDLVDGHHTLGAFRIGADGSLTSLGTVGTLPAGSIGLAAA